MPRASTGAPAQAGALFAESGRARPAGQAAALFTEEAFGRPKRKAQKRATDEPETKPVDEPEKKPAKALFEDEEDILARPRAPKKAAAPVDDLF
jgi:hypothetical protein